MFTLNSNSDEEVLRAQNDDQYMNRYIEKNKKFIMTCAYRTVNHFVSESDDEWSIALIAFHEAIRSYDSEKGDFHKFAGVVINRRLVDFLRSESRHAGEISVDPISMSGELDNETEVSALQLEIRRREAEISETRNAGSDGTTPAASAVKDEIEAMQLVLHSYGFSFFDLTECSPKTEKTKTSCAKAVNVLLTDRPLLGRMRLSRALPIKALVTLAKVAKKILERHRKYIIASTEILDGDFPNLAEYLSYIRKTGTAGEKV